MSNNLVKVNSAQSDTSIKSLFSALNLLVKPAEQGSTGELNDILELNVRCALKELKIENLSNLATLKSIKCPVLLSSSVRWRFVCVSLHVLLQLKRSLGQRARLGAAEVKPERPRQQPPPDVLSVAQQKLIRTCLQFVVSIGLLPSLLPGVGISLAARCTSAHNLKEEELLVLEKYERLSSVTRGLVACCEQPTLHSLVLAQHLGDLMAALAQLSFVPLKRPEEGAGDEGRWERLQGERKQFQKCFLSFVAQVYQPYIIRELLLLRGSPEVIGIARVPPPSWLKRVCVQQLVYCLTRPGGVGALAAAILDSGPDSASDWSKQDTVARLVTHVHTLNAEQYFSNVCAQLIQLLNADGKAHAERYSSVAVLCIKTLYEKKPLMCMRYILDVMMRPLLLSCDVSGHGPVFYREVELLTQKIAKLNDPQFIPSVDALTEDPSGRLDVAVIATEEEVSRCVAMLHRCFVAPQSEMSSLPADLLAPVASPLFRLHQKIYSSASSLKRPVQELLLKFVSGSSQLSMRDIYGAFLFRDRAEGMLDVSDKVEFAFGPSGGVLLQLHTEDVDTLVMFEQAGDCLLELLSVGDAGGDLANSLFVSLLLVLTQKPDLPFDGGVACDPPDTDRFISSIVGHSDRSVVAIRLLATLAESPAIQERIVKDPTHVIHFIRHMLEKDASFLLKGEEEGPDSSVDLESLFVVLMVLSVMISDPGPTDAKWEPFKELIKPLKIIRQNVTNQDLKKFADKLYDTLVTHGVVKEPAVKGSQKPKGRSKEPKKAKGKGDKPKSARSNVEGEGGQPPAVSEQDTFHGRVEEDEDEEDGGEGSSEGPGARLDWKKQSRYEQALFEVCDPLLPVRGHALQELIKLVKEGDIEALCNKKHIVSILQENIRHEDSYIYLTAINGLAYMATYFPNTILKTLIEEFRGVRGRKHESDEELSALKMKLGEVLVRTTKQLGEILPHYKAMLVGTFLNGTKDNDPFIRSSSLSNLGEVCKVLGYRIGPIITEIFVCVRSIVQSDQSPVVRRAAVLVITSLLQGLGKDTLTFLENALLELYRVLKAVHRADPDDTVRHHAQLALEELQRSTLDFLFPEQKLQKELFILNAPQS
ncbi:transport and Golgi organization protein 6 homolog [Bacillus rossius redtenbacheri]|uniref:transport and Golgi organization protein 6 homolog n=1 Tax=Bacillus rossius redtenbacheri TaxID=93214 RepID=UPI002FDDD9AE